MIHSVTVDRAPARFETTNTKLVVSLPAVAKVGQKFDIEIQYDGKPSKGLYFIFPMTPILSGPRRSGHKANPKTRAFICPPTIIRMTA